MARARNIKPGFFKNEELAQCKHGARLVFIGLWCLADREGRLEDRPGRIKAELFPYESIDIDVCLGQLSAKGFIVRYECDGGKFIQVSNFCKHQNPHCKESASTIPAPGLHNASTEVARLIPDSLLLIPDSLIPAKPNEQSQTSEIKRFIPPTLTEVTAYCLERQNQVDPCRFIDHYETVGWMVGKSKMRNWKAAIRTWEKNNFQGGARQPAPTEPRRIVNEPIPKSMKPHRIGID